MEVTFAMLGILEPRDETTWRFVAGDSAEVRVFEVVATGDGWRIASPQMEQHILPRDGDPQPRPPSSRQRIFD